ncbi:uncharacterized protein LOC119515281 [Choloepus didactylus]|uniref:uncharacterized protein LOC119515281 n=1 Tax=Choloepus didactylus TaxID=27675 RepID=UPI0018A0BB89|nr:uncharacterized protein LOC119515281 [Choloepus didactylus]
MRMLLLWGSLLCWGLLPQARGEAQHLLCLRISKSQLETDISDLLFQSHILDHVTRLPVSEATGEDFAVLDYLPFVGKRLSKKSSGLDLSLVGELLLGEDILPLKTLIGSGGLVIEDAKGPEVSLQILSDSLLQVTLRSKLYLSLQGIMQFKVIKNIRIGVRLEQTGNKTKVAFEECHIPPGYLSIEVLKQMNPLLVQEALKLVTSMLDEVLPFLLQKTVCPLATTLVNALLNDLLHIILPPNTTGTEDFQYYVTSTEFTEEAILMKVQLVTPCRPGQRAARPNHLVPHSLPKLTSDSMADLVFELKVYNNILACLYRSKVIGVDPRDPAAAHLIWLLSRRELGPDPQASYQSRASVRLTISTPDPPTVHLDGHKATVTQLGSLVLLGPSNSSSIAISWILHSEAVFSSRDGKLNIQFSPDRLPCRDVEAVIATWGEGVSFSCPSTFPSPFPNLVIWLQCPLKVQSPGLLLIPCGHLYTFLWLESADPAEVTFPFLFHRWQAQHLQPPVSALLQRIFVPLHNERLRGQSLPLPDIKGISFDQSRMLSSEDYMLLTIPE